MRAREHESRERRLEKLKIENLSFREKLSALKKENENLQRLLRDNNKLINSIPAGIVLIQQGKIIYINETALDQMGYKAEEIIDRDFLDFVHPDLKGFVRNLHKKWVSGKSGPEQHETDMVTKNGGTLCFDVRVNKIRFNGRVALLLNLTRLEKRKKREKDLIRSKKMEALITMASGLTRNFGHNLKTYLRSVSPVEGDPNEIQDVIANMILNAVEAMPRGGELYLTTEESAGYAHIYIQDSGEGITDNIRDRIFDPFLTTKGNDGVGLGLSLSYAIVKRNRGDIEVTSQKDQGSIFHVRLPLASQEQKPKVRSVRRKIKNADILIIEDEDVLMELLSQLFLSKGLRVDTAATGAEGLGKLKRKNFDMLLVDSGTPDIKEGLFIKKIKKLYPKLPIAIIMENETGDKLNQIKNSSVDLVITKPVEMNRLMNQVSEILAAKVGL